MSAMKVTSNFPIFKPDTISNWISAITESEKGIRIKMIFFFQNKYVTNFMCFSLNPRRRKLITLLKIQTFN